MVHVRESCEIRPHLYTTLSIYNNSWQENLVKRGTLVLSKYCSFHLDSHACRETPRKGEKGAERRSSAHHVDHMLFATICDIYANKTSLLYRL